MIHLSLEGKRIIIRNCFEQRDAIKGLSSYPDVKWLVERKVWSVDARLYDKLAASCGACFAPLSDDFLRALPMPEERVTGYYPALKREAEAKERERVQRYAKRKVAVR